jgi:hypothetical protein
LREHSTPDTAVASRTGTTYAYGTPVPIECQAVGETVYGSYVWDRIADDRYVADAFTTTTGGLSFTTGIPRCDRIRPVPTLAGVPLATKHAQRTFMWSATDDASGIASFDVRYRRAPYNGGFGRWTYVNDTTARQLSVPMSAGYDYCLQVRATDRSFNTSGWTAPACIARALDDRSLAAATGGWTRGGHKGYYFRTFTGATSRGRTLTRSGAQLDRVGIVVTRCPTCGKVDVYVGKKFLGTVPLHAASLQRSKIVLLPPFSLRTRLVRLVTHGPSLVRIDGLVVSRT